MSPADTNNIDIEQTLSARMTLPELFHSFWEAILLLTALTVAAQLAIHLFLS